MGQALSIGDGKRVNPLPTPEFSVTDFAPFMLAPRSASYSPVIAIYLSLSLVCA